MEDSHPSYSSPLFGLKPFSVISYPCMFVPLSIFCSHLVLKWYFWFLDVQTEADLLVGLLDKEWFLNLNSIPNHSAGEYWTETRPQNITLNVPADSWRKLDLT